jgi:methylmalonyl-CoA/ethylmalonyl-CoA epimerase
VLDSLDHVGVAVADLDAAIELHQRRFDMRLEHRETVEDFGVEIAHVGVGSQRVELLMPLRSDVPIGIFIDRHGPGIHHVAYRTPDIDAALAALAGQGARLLDDCARPGLCGTRVAYLHPKSTGGVLTELVEPPSLS